MKKLIAIYGLALALLFSTACSPASQSRAFAIIDGVLASAESVVALLDSNQQLPAGTSAAVNAYVSSAMAIGDEIEKNLQSGTPLTQASADLAVLTQQLNTLQGVPSNVKIYLTEINAGLQLLIPIISPLISSTGDIHVSNLSLALDPKIVAPPIDAVRVRFLSHPILYFKMRSFHGRMNRLRAHLKSTT